MTDSDLIMESDVKGNLWSIRPCHLYKGLICKSYFLVVWHLLTFTRIFNCRRISRLQINQIKISTVLRSRWLSGLFKLGTWFWGLCSFWGKGRRKSCKKYHWKRSKAKKGAVEGPFRQQRLEEEKQPTWRLEQATSRPSKQRIWKFFLRHKVQGNEGNRNIIQWKKRRNAIVPLHNHVIIHPVDPAKPHKFIYVVQVIFILDYLVV